MEEVKKMDVRPNEMLMLQLLQLGVVVHRQKRHMEAAAALDSDMESNKVKAIPG